MAATKPGISRDLVLATAIQIADADGLGALSMRGLGSRLGVEAMSLYHHVSNKRDLLAGIATLAWSEVAIAPPGTPWRPALRELAQSMHQMLLRHTWMISKATVPGGTGQLHCINAMLGYLRESGFEQDVAYHAQHVFDGYVFGFTQEMVEYGINVQTLEDDVAQLAATGALDGLVHLQEHIGAHVEHAKSGGESGFDFGLDLILDSLERLRGERSAGPARPG